MYYYTTIQSLITIYNITFDLYLISLFHAFNKLCIRRIQIPLLEYASHTLK